MAFLTGTPLPTATPLCFFKASMSSRKALSLSVSPHTFYYNNLQNRKVEVNAEDNNFPKDSFTGARTQVTTCGTLMDADFYTYITFSPQITENYNIILTLNRTLTLRSKYKPISHKMRPKCTTRTHSNLFSIMFFPKHNDI